MNEAKGDLFTKQGTAFVITTNGYFTHRGAVMGRGCAKQLVDYFPDAPMQLKRALQEHGNHTQVFMDVGVPVIAFPVKPQYVVYDGNNVVTHAKHRYSLGQSVPGFHAKACPELIQRSAIELVELVNQTQGDKANIVMPRPGCGAGELDWDSHIKPILSVILDDRFTVYTF